MNIHYFQRYHRKEDVATANTMLLLSRLYSYSPTVFYTFLKNEYFSNTFNPEIFFNLQEKNSNSVPDATIGQESFKIVIETKLENNPFTINNITLSWISDAGSATNCTKGSRVLWPNSLEYFSADL